MIHVQHDDGWSPDWATHPGEHLEEHIDAHGWTQAEFARLSGLNKKLVSEIISGKNPVTPETAIVLERVLGLKAYVWSGLQSNWDLFQARKAKSKVDPETRDWMKCFPLKELRASGVLPDAKDDDEQTLDGLLGFLGIGAPGAFDAKVQNLCVHHRQSNGDVSKEHIFSWLMLGEQCAREMNLPPFNRDAFEGAVHVIRGMTNERAEVFSPRMVELCGAAGVALVFVRPFSKTKLYGSARWLSEDRAIIQMSLRMKKNDHFWWTFFHECAHILLHKGKNFADDAPGGNGEEFEKEANAWTEEILVGKGRFAEFVATSPTTKAEVCEFAESINLHPGIVVGMLQHVREIHFGAMNDLKATFEFAD